MSMSGSAQRAYQRLDFILLCRCLRRFSTMRKQAWLPFMLMCGCVLLCKGIAAGQQDGLRGGNGPGRSWWDVQHYTLTVHIDTASDEISGSNCIRFRIVAPPSDRLQLDLQEGLKIDSVLDRGNRLTFTQDGDVWWVNHSFHKQAEGSVQELMVYYHGVPRVARNPPWDGGIVRTRDSAGRLWMAVACQGLGASSWWPCKDMQADEPDSGMIIRLVTNSHLPLISNGRQIAAGAPVADSTWRTWVWQVRRPINNYNVTFYLGDYVHWTDTMLGLKGRLDLDFYALRANEEKARQQFAVVKSMLHCFEYWMGPYPFYEDGYKIVEAPYLGMEHQSAVAYGNRYQMGYLGMDRSGTGVGLSFDFIIVHESGHEWFGNSITAADVADNWIHEGFTTYAEALFAECLLGREQAFTYAPGQWKNIRNDRPIVGRYGVSDGGTSDRYEKGAAVVHTIRLLLDDDMRFRQWLHALQDTFGMKTIRTAELESFTSWFTGIDLSPVFNQYLRQSDIPELTYFIKDKKLFYRFRGAVPGLRLPVRVSRGKKYTEVIFPTSDWQYIPWNKGYDPGFSTPFLIRLP
jgi:aminopeptidase N